MKKIRLAFLGMPASFVRDGVADPIPGLVKLSGTNASRVDDVKVYLKRNPLVDGASFRTGVGETEGQSSRNGYVILAMDVAGDYDLDVALKQDPKFPTDPTKKIPRNFLDITDALEYYNGL